MTTGLNTIPVIKMPSLQIDMLKSLKVMVGLPCILSYHSDVKSAVSELILIDKCNFQMKKTEKYIADGQIFDTFEEVVGLAKKSGLRITNTETLKTKRGKRHIIALNK